MKSTKAKLKKVGTLTNLHAKQIEGISANTNIYINEKGLKSKINKKHPEDLKYIDLLSNILNTPDYVGVSPKEQLGKSFELVKKLDNHVQIGVKLDLANDYWFVATVYRLEYRKVQNRIKTGRLKKFKEKV